MKLKERERERDGGKGNETKGKVRGTRQTNFPLHVTRRIATYSRKNYLIIPLHPRPFLPPANLVKGKMGGKNGKKKERERGTNR